MHFPDRSNILTRIKKADTTLVSNSEIQKIISKNLNTALLLKQTITKIINSLPFEEQQALQKKDQLSEKLPEKLINIKNQLDTANATINLLTSVVNNQKT